MNKLFITLLFFFLTIIISAQDLNIELNYFNKKVNIGLKSMARQTLYFKAFNGGIYINFGNDGKIVAADEIIVVSIKGGKIFCNGNYVEKIESLKKDITAMAGISSDGKNFRTYRGEMSFIVETGLIVPINTLFLEEYLYSVVPSEIGEFFPDEAIKAQILAARSYTYSKINENLGKQYQLVDGTDSQMYLGYQRENPKINRLVNETQGEVICYDSKPIIAYYHSTSGGFTANIEEVWNGNPVPYLKMVDDTGNGDESPRSVWSFSIKKSEFSKKVGFNVNGIIIEEMKNGRVTLVKIFGDKSMTISGNELRKIIGYNKIFSTIFDVFDFENELIFAGRGSGHGVGMAQWGACGLAKKGKNYKEIVKFYYTGVEIINLEKYEKYDIITK